MIPFLPAETAKGGLRTIFTGGDALGPASVIFQVARTEFLKSNAAAVRAYLADYVQGLAWYNDPANRTKAIEIISDYLKSPKDDKITIILDLDVRYHSRGEVTSSSRPAFARPLHSAFATCARATRSRSRATLNS